MRSLFFALALSLGTAHASTCEQLMATAQASRTFTTFTRGSAATVTTTTMGVPFTSRVVLLKADGEDYYLHVTANEGLGRTKTTVNKLVGSTGNIEQLCREGRWSAQSLGNGRHSLQGRYRAADNIDTDLRIWVDLSRPMIHNPEKAEVRYQGVLVTTIATVAAPAVDIQTINLRNIPLCEGLPLPGIPVQLPCSGPQDLSFLKN